MLDGHILDYYHLRKHVVQASHGLYGKGRQKAEQWREEMMDRQRTPPEQSHSAQNEYPNAREIAVTAG